MGEPRFRYQSLVGDVTQLLMRSSASCLAVSDKMLALGTSSGSVHLLDYAGNEVHPKPLNLEGDGHGGGWRKWADDLQFSYADCRIPAGCVLCRCEYLHVLSVLNAFPYIENPRCVPVYVWGGFLIHQGS